METWQKILIALTAIAVSILAAIGLVALVVFLYLTSTIEAHAGGSASLQDVMDQLENDKLNTEISSELKKQNLKVDDDNVGCEGSRFGNQWTNLGGARSIPYECLVGNRTLIIKGKLHLYDKSGKELNMYNEKTFDKADDYKATDLKWKWTEGNTE